jgi:DNA-binding NarL/FixJ family response regulator
MNLNIKLIIADDHEVYRDGLRALLQNVDELEVVAEAATGKQLISVCEEKEPDVVLTDIIMPVMDGIKAAAHLAEHMPAVRVIALSMFNEDHLILDMLNAGASGYLIKNAHKREITDAIHSVYNNKPYYCSSTSHKLARLIGQRGPHNKKKVHFSTRELEIIQMICEEKTTKQIGDHLNMSARTAEEYRQKIRMKMDVKTTTGMVIYAIRNDLFRIEK